jgi:hypothetical protein
MAGGIDWFRWHHGSVTDPKFQLVARRAGASLPDVLAVWAYILEAASASADRGAFGDIDAEALDCLFNFPASESRTADILTAMEARGLVAAGRIAAWDKRQPKREREGDNSTERSKKHREAKKAAENAEQAHATPRNATQRQETPREEESREENNNNTASVDARQRFEMFEGWQPDEVSLAPQLKTMGVQPSQVTPGAVAEFVSYWITQHNADTQAAWCRKLVLAIRTAGVRTAAEPSRLSRQSRPTTSKHVGLTGQDLVSGLEANDDGTYSL